ncbi:MAG: hypothetical protein AB2747_08485 [Candidatus Thiodiazotropha taylori]
MPSHAPAHTIFKSTATDYSELNLTYTELVEAIQPNGRHEYQTRLIFSISSAQATADCSV